nr:uncharacterized protein LOC116277825 [Vicugna pacos]
MPQERLSTTVWRSERVKVKDRDRAGFSCRRQGGAAGREGRWPHVPGCQTVKPPPRRASHFYKQHCFPAPPAHFLERELSSHPPRPRGSASQAPGRGEDRPEAASGGFRRLTPSCSLPPADLAPPPRPPPPAGRAQRPRPPRPAPPRLRPSAGGPHGDSGRSAEAAAGTEQRTGARPAACFPASGQSPPCSPRPSGVLRPFAICRLFPLAQESSTRQVYMPSIRPEQSRRGRAGSQTEVESWPWRALGIVTVDGGRVRRRSRGAGFSTDSAAAGILEATPGSASESRCPSDGPSTWDLSLWPCAQRLIQPIGLVHLLLL